VISTVTPTGIALITSRTAAGIFLCVDDGMNSLQTAGRDAGIGHRRGTSAPHNLGRHVWYVVAAARVTLKRMIDEDAATRELIEALFFSTVEPLATCHASRGAGCYLLLYRGELDLYAPIAGCWPVYAGATTTSLAGRLSEHRRNLADVDDLSDEDFDVVTFPTVSLHLAGYLEALATASFRPVWNHRLLSGFGSRFQGRARTHQHRAAWTVLHPGRRCSTGAALHSRDELVAITNEHLARTAPPRGVEPFGI
jgi:hypothetical protein